MYVAFIFLCIISLTFAPTDSLRKERWDEGYGHITVTPDCKDYYRLYRKFYSFIQVLYPDLQRCFFLSCSLSLCLLYLNNQYLCVCDVACRALSWHSSWERFDKALSNAFTECGYFRPPYDYAVRDLFFPHWYCKLLHQIINELCDVASLANPRPQTVM